MAIIKLAILGSGDNTVFWRYKYVLLETLKRPAILLFLGKDPFSTSKVDVKLYNVTFYYIDIDGDKTRIASDSCLKQVINNPPHKRNEKDDFKYDRQFYTEPGEVKVFAGVEKKHNQESSTLGSAAESSIQTVHSARSISLTTPQTNELRHLLIKLALAGFGDDTTFCRIFVCMAHVNVAGFFNFQELKRRAILLSLGEDSSSTNQVDVELYRVVVFYTDVGGDKVLITSDNDLTDVGSQFNTKGEVKVFASVDNKKDEQKSPTLESAAESPTQTAHSVTSTSNSTAATHEMGTCIVKLALVGSGDDVVFSRIKYATNPGRFESMKKRAIWLSLGEEDAQVDIARYKVAFFYTDSHGDKVSIESDSDIFSAANQFTRGGLKVFATVQSVQDVSKAPPTKGLKSLGSVARTSTQPTASVANLTTQAACNIATASLSPSKALKELQDIVTAVTAAAAAVAVVAVWEHVPPPTNSTAQASDSVPASESRNTGDRFRTAPTSTAAHSVPLIYSANDTRGDRFQTAPTIAARFNASKEQEGDDETAASMSELAALKNYKTTCKQAGISDETACETESDDETADFTPPRTHKEYQLLYLKATKSSVPKEVDIVSKGDAVPSFASDAEGSGEIAGVLGETLDRVAQAIDDMYLEFDRTSSPEEIVVEATKDKEDVDEDGSSNTRQPKEDVEDDCSPVSWNVVSDHSNDEESCDY